MSDQSGSRVRWSCPDCGRDYQLPAGRTPPSICKQCTRRNQKAAASASAPAAVPATPPTVKELTDLPVMAPRREAVLPAEVEAHISRQERERLMADVANISRTMTFFRRLVWAMVILMFLNFILVGAAFFYSMRQLSSLGGLVPGGADAGQVVPQGQGNGANLPPGIAEKLKPIQDYYKSLDELSRDSR